MIRKMPLVPTIIVAIAVLIMMGLGVWQLQRAREKEALIARYEAARQAPPISFPTIPVSDANLPLFRHSTGNCLQPVDRRVTAGRNRGGETGYVHIVDCRTGAEGPGMAVQLGWSKDPQAQFEWSGGLVSGVIVPDRQNRMRLVAAQAPEGLQPSAVPSVESIPNNHRMYAVQWFLFAVLAVIIYLFALRSRLAAKDEEPRP